MCSWCNVSWNYKPCNPVHDFERFYIDKNNNSEKSFLDYMQEMKKWKYNLRFIYMIISQTDSTLLSQRRNIVRYVWLFNKDFCTVLKSLTLSIPIHRKYVRVQFDRFWYVASFNLEAWLRWWGCQYVSRHCIHKSFNWKQMLVTMDFSWTITYPSGLSSFNHILNRLEFWCQ